MTCNEINIGHFKPTGFVNMVKAFCNVTFIKNGSTKNFLSLTYGSLKKWAINNGSWNLKTTEIRIRKQLKVSFTTLTEFYLIQLKVSLFIGELLGVPYRGQM